jgi:hypothetical protein
MHLVPPVTSLKKARNLAALSSMCWATTMPSGKTPTLASAFLSSPKPSSPLWTNSPIGASVVRVEVFTARLILSMVR